MFWSTFLAEIEDYAIKHFVRNGEMTEEEALSKIEVDNILFRKLVDNTNAVETVYGIEVDVIIEKD